MIVNPFGSSYRMRSYTYRAASAAFAALLLLISLTPDLFAFKQAGSPRTRIESDAGKRAEELFQQALILSDANKQDAARASLREAMRLWERNREPEKAAKAALQVGDLCKLAKLYPDALYYYNLALAEKSISHGIMAYGFKGMALVYVALYQRELASHCFAKALEHAKLANDVASMTQSLIGLAQLHYEQGETSRALKLISEAEKLNKGKGAEPDLELLCLVGHIRQKEGLLSKAKACFEEALAGYTRAHDIGGQVRALCAISTILLLTSEKEAALDQAKKAVALADGEAKRGGRHGDNLIARESRWRAWLSCARAEKALDHKQLANSAYVRTIGQMTALWWTVYIVSEASAIAFMEEAQAAHREYVDLLVDLGDLKQAYGYADRAKARVMRNETEARNRTPGPEDKALQDDLREISRLMRQKRTKLINSKLRSEQAALQKEIGDLEAESQKRIVQAQMEHHQDRLDAFPQTVSSDNLRGAVARDGLTVAEFSLGDNRSFLWLFTGGEMYFEVLPPREKIEEKVRQYLGMLVDPPDPFTIDTDLKRLKARGEELFGRLFGRLATKIEPGQKLIVVPDGLLHYLPFEALIRNGRYLIEDHDFSYSPSATMMTWWQNAQIRPALEDKLELLAVGKTEFESDADVLPGTRSKNNRAERTPKSLAVRDSKLGSLPRAAEEVKYIGDLFRPDQRIVLFGSEATEGAVKSRLRGHIRRIHFATHGLLDDKMPWKSGIVLGPGDDGVEDGLLEADEISRLHLDCDLVVLSACQTGRGRLYSGEGIVGLSRAFLGAGTRAVVVSLWNVSDRSASHLMKDFYQRLAENVNNAAALRAAKLRMINGGKDTRHPYYWAPFVVVGKP